MSAIGTKRTYRVELHMSGLGAKADIARRTSSTSRPSRATTSFGFCRSLKEARGLVQRWVLF